MTMGSDMFDVHIVNEDNIEDILEVYRQNEDFLALGPEPKASMEMVLKDLEISRLEGGCFCGIFQSDKKMVGIVDYIPHNFERENGVAFISLLMIATSFRGKGLGTEIVKLIEDEIIKESNPRVICVAVQTNNLAALRFWQKNAYTIIRGPEFRPDQTTVYYLQKEIK